MTDSLATTRRALDLDPGDAELLIELASRQIDANQDREADRWGPIGKRMAGEAIGTFALTRP